jgi:flagellar hook-associated protein 2
MSAVSFSGLASGIDSKALIQATLDQQRAAFEKPLTQKITDYQDTNTAFSKLRDLLNSLKTAASKFRALNGSALSKQAASSDETILTALASNSATNGTYSLTTTALAKNATFSFQSGSAYTSPDSVINASINNGASSASRTISVMTGSGSDQETVDIAVDNGTTLSQFVSQFNNTSTKATASVINVGSTAAPDYRVAIVSNNQGTQKGQLSVSVGSEITSAGSGAFNSNTLQQATDATFSISGINGTITRATNSISDVIPGITFELQATGSATVAVSDDKSKTTGTIQDFVNAYNDVVKFISDNNQITQEKDATTNETNNIFGPLANTSVDDNALGALRSAIVGSSTSGRTVNTLADLGITTQRDGTLLLNTDTLNSALSNDPEGARTITQNLGETLASVGGSIDQFTRFSGLIDQTTQSNNSQITDMQNRVNDFEKNLGEQEKSMTAQFARLEALIGKLQSQQSTLSSILPK